MNPLILVLDRYSQKAVERVKAKQNLKVEVHPLEDIPKEALKQAQGILIRTKVKATKEFLDQLPELKIIVTATTGFDHIDLNEAKKRNIKVLFTPDANVHSAAELTWALVLASARKITTNHNLVQSGQWTKTLDRKQFHGVELYDKNYGVIGLGRIGSKVARIAQSFGMHVVAYDPHKDNSWFDQLRVERLGLSELLRSCEVVSLHVPLTEETKHLINQKTLALLQPGSILVNTSRGPVVNEQDLSLALDRLFFAGLDVFESEPLPPGSPLFKNKNIVFSPHCGGTTDEAFQRSCMMAADKIIAFFDNKEVGDGDPFMEPWLKSVRS